MTTNTLTVTARGDREAVIVRRFDAPRRLVFDAMTKPELLARWFYGPPGWSLAVCEVDLVVGGAYRYVALSTLILTEHAGTTTLTNTMIYSSREARDAVLKTPMEQGMAMGYDRLEAMMASMPIDGSNS